MNTVSMETCNILFGDLAISSNFCIDMFSLLSLKVFLKYVLLSALSI